MSEISILKRASESRGRTELSWLQSRHSFSFGDFYDPEYLGFCDLRIVNEDIVAGGAGFGMHPHHSMEIFSYVISGELAHEDSEGNRGVILPGGFQYLSAGKGTMHSEINPSESTPVHFLQIWIEPNVPGGKPKYDELRVPDHLPGSGLVLLASEDGRHDSIQIRQKANLWFGGVDEGQVVEILPESNGRNFWIQVIDGDIELGENQEFLLTGDGAAVSAENGFSAKANEKSEFIVIEL